MKRKYRVQFDLDGKLFTEVYADSIAEAEKIAQSMEYGELVTLPVREVCDEVNVTATVLGEIKHYELIVGNVGTVYDSKDTTDGQALAEFDVFVEASKQDYGRASGEDVFLVVDGEPEREYVGHLSENTQALENE